MKRTRDSIRGFVLGVTLTALVVAAPSAMATAMKKTIDVVYNDIKLVVDGKTVTPKDANGNVVEPFTYNGTTYLPVRAVVNAITGGTKDVEWEQATSTIYIGEKPEVEVVGMATLVPFSGNARFLDEYEFTSRQQKYTVDSLFYASGMCAKNGGGASAIYLLNGEYDEFKATVAPIDGEGDFDVYISDGDTFESLKVVSVKAGDKPIELSVSVAGMDKLRIAVSTKMTWIGNAGTPYSYSTKGALFNATLTRIQSGN